MQLLWTHRTCLFTIYYLLPTFSLVLFLFIFSRSKVLLLFQFHLTLYLLSSSLLLSFSFTAMNPSEEFLEQGISQQVQTFFLAPWIQFYFSLSYPKRVRKMWCSYYLFCFLCFSLCFIDLVFWACETVRVIAISGSLHLWMRNLF